MYQGKFDSKNKGTSVDVHELVSQRNSAPAKKPSAPAPAPVKKQSAPVKKQPVQSREPVRKQEPQEVPEKRKGPRLGGVIFYTFYFMFILLFFVATYFGLQWLNGWLYDYEAAQPTTKCQEVFDQLFADPDWGYLYDLAGVEGTQYEGKEEFVSYMEAKVGDNDLTFLETSAGLSTDKKYVVRLGNENIATFTLSGETANKIDIPEWNLGTVELFYKYEGSYLIELASNHTASVNGVELDDSFTIQIASTRAESSGLLPIGTTFPKTYTQQITGLMAVPTVTVVDDAGKEVEVSYNAETKTFTAQTEANTMTDEQREVALGAIKTYAEFGIKEASTGALSVYFDTSGEAYDSITNTVLSWTKDNYGYTFENDSVTGYARYSDTLFSVYVTTEMSIKLTDGGTQEKPINATLLFELQDGKWKVIRMSNADISLPVGEVRLTFMNGDTLLDSKFVKNDAETLATPLVSAPEGKVFAGWIAELENEQGVKEWTLIFTPDESGNVPIASGTTLKPMTLYAYFENASAAGANESTEGA